MLHFYEGFPNSGQVWKWFKSLKKGWHWHLWKSLYYWLDCKMLIPCIQCLSVWLELSELITSPSPRAGPAPPCPCPPPPPRGCTAPPAPHPDSCLSALSAMRTLWVLSDPIPVVSLMKLASQITEKIHIRGSSHQDDEEAATVQWILFANTCIRKLSKYLIYEYILASVLR